jgi:hypothetical protein
LPRKYGDSPFWLCKFQPFLEAPLLYGSLLGKTSTLIASPLNPSGEKSGQQSANMFVGSYGWLGMTKSSMNILAPPFRLLSRLNLFSWKQPNITTSTKIHCSDLKNEDGSGH